MIERTDEEIKELINGLWGVTPEIYRWRDEVHVTLGGSRAPGLTFKQLMGVSEFFGTKNIEDGDRFRSHGCDTCDYGSYESFTLMIRPDGGKTSE